MEDKIKLAVVTGPTASGKTALAVELALQLNGEIIGADSMQIYKGLPIATAQPTLEEQKGVPHHLIGFLPPESPFSLAEYLRLAGEAIEGIVSRGNLPILCGGTGLYADTLLRGIRLSESGEDPAYRAELQALADAEGGGKLREMLTACDPDYAAGVHENNIPRLIRALEVYRETGKTISAHNAETAALPPRYDAVWIGLQFRDRADMKALIDRRVDAMVAAGLLEEVRQLLESGLPREATALQAIGYKEFLGVLDGTAAVEEAVAEVKLRSRQYAKRQLTWLRRNPDIHWIWWEKDRDFARALQVSTEILTAAGVS